MNYLPSCDLIVFVFMGLVYKIDDAAGKVPPQRLSAVHKHQRWSNIFNKIFNKITARNEVSFFISVLLPAASDPAKRLLP